MTSNSTVDKYQHTQPQSKGDGRHAVIETATDGATLRRVSNTKGFPIVEARVQHSPEGEIVEVGFRFPLRGGPETMVSWQNAFCGLVTPEDADAACRVLVRLQFDPRLILNAMATNAYASSRIAPPVWLVQLNEKPTEELRAEIAAGEPKKDFVFRRRASVNLCGSVKWPLAQYPDNGGEPEDGVWMSPITYNGYYSVYSTVVGMTRRQALLAWLRTQLNGHPNCISDVLQEVARTEFGIPVTNHDTGNAVVSRLPKE